MSDIVAMLNMINDAIFVSLVNTTLQMTLLISLIALVIWMFRVKSAAMRYSLWLFVLFAIIALPLITPLIPQMDFAQLHSRRATGDVPDELMRLRMGGSDVGELSESGDPVTSMGAAEAAADGEADVPLINPVSVAYFIWCAGALSMLCTTIAAHRKLRKLRMNSPGVENPAALEMLFRLKQRLRVRRPVALKVSPEIYTPVSVGVFCPTIIFPDGVIGNSPQPPLRKGEAVPPFVKGGLGGISELEMILTHELAHIKRCDYLVNFLQNMLRAIFFFHPLFHLMNRNLAREREHICDDWVIHVTNRRRGYAECIVSLLEKTLYQPVNVPVTIAMAERKRDIPGRIDMIMDKKRKMTTKIPRKALIAVFLVGCLSLPIVGGIKLVRVVEARQASNEGRIVFTRYTGGAGCIFVMDADGKNQRQLTTGDDSDVEWSPDGKQIAFGHLDPFGIASICIMDADGSNMKQLTDGPEDYFPTWSPDGKQIAFTREVWEQKDGDWNLKSGGIYVVNSDGANLKRLTEQCDREPDWSPDGGKIVFYLWRLGIAVCDVCVMDADGGNRKMLNHWAYRPAWSPDGAKIAFSSEREAWNAWKSSDIYVMDADGANVKRLTEPGPSWEDYPTWSPDGAKIAFVSDRHDPSKQRDIYVMNADASNIQRITNTPEYEITLDWTAFSYSVEPAGKLKSTWGKIKRELFGK